MQALITIDVAKKQFQNWRNTKSPGDRMPDELWAIVGQILANPTYKKSIVGHELGISTTQLRGKFPERFPPRNKPIAEINKSNFVHAPLTSVMSGLVIERKDGNRLIINAASNEQFTTLIKAFME